MVVDTPSVSVSPSLSVVEGQVLGSSGTQDINVCTPVSVSSHGQNELPPLPPSRSVRNRKTTRLLRRLGVYTVIAVYLLCVMVESLIRQWI